MAVLVPFIFGAIGSSLAAGTAYTALAYAVGATIGTMLVAPKGQDQRAYGARLMDLKATHTEYGSPIHIKLGQSRGAGTIIWQSDFRELATTTTQEQDGCCGGGSSSSYTNYTYFVDLLILLNDIPTDALARVWLNSELVYNVKSDADDDTVYASIHNNQYWSEIRFYSGAPDQLPDPYYEAAKGVGNAPAHRGATTVFIKNLALGVNDQLPSLEFELFEKATSAIPEPRTVALTGSYYQPSREFISAYDAASDTIWLVDYVWQDITAPSFTIEVWSNATMTELSSIVFAPGLGNMRVGGLVEHKGEMLLSFGVEGMRPQIARFNISTRTLINIYEYGATHVSSIGGSYTQITSNGDDVFLIYFNNVISGSLRMAVIRSFSEDGEIANDLRMLQTVIGLSITYLKPMSIKMGGDKILVVRGNNLLPPEYSIIDAYAPTVSFTGTIEYTDQSGIDYDSARGLFISVPSNGTFITTISASTGVKTVTNITTYNNADAGYSQDFESIAYHSILDKYIVSAKAQLGTTTTIHQINPDTLESDLSYVYSGAGIEGGLFIGGKNGWYALSFDDTNALVRRYYLYVNTYTAVPKTLQETVVQLCDISGLSASDIDVTALSAITTPVEGLTITSATSMRQPLEALMGSYYFTACQSGDKIKFTPRGGSSLATFAYDDLGASFGDSTESALSFNMGSDTELPSRVSVTYQVLQGDYQKDTQMSDRLVTAETNTVSDVMLPIIMSAEQAKGVAITNALDAQMSLMSAKIKVLFDHPELESGDVVTVTDRDGSQYRMRITQITDSFPIREFDLVLDDASILTYSGITNADFFSQSVVLPLVDSDGLYLDIPILSDINNDAGFYVVSGPVAEGKWYGAVTLQSDNDLDYVSGVVVPERGYFGSCTTTLGDWTGYHVFDEQNSITISIQTDAVLTNSTRAGILASPLTNAFLIGNEIIQAVNCTELSAGVWKLTRLLRGLRGTEWAMIDHVAGERAVWLRSEGMRRLPMTNSRLGLTRYYKTFSNNRAAADYDGEAFVNMAIGMKPFSPTTARGARDLSGNLTITWQRRTRLSCRYGGAMGVSIPLGENTELYEIDIYSDDTYATAVRGFASTTPTCEYTAAQQVIDFGSAQAVVYVKIYQISQVVDRGYALTGAV